MITKSKIYEISKNNIWWLPIGILVLVLSIIQKTSFFAIIYIYVILINILLSDFLRRKIKKIIMVILCILLVVTFGLTIYVNYHLPHGPIYQTGGYSCEYDGRGPCHPDTVEDMSKLNIPDWAKFIRRNFIGLFLGLGLAATACGDWRKKDD